MSFELTDEQREIRDAKFTAGFRHLFKSAGIRCLRTPFLAPDANAFAEAWIGAFKRECLDYFLCFSLGHLNHVAQEYVRFFNTHRPHQGLGNQTLPAARAGPPEEPAMDDSAEIGQVRCRRFLGGLLRHYHRAAA